MVRTIPLQHRDRASTAYKVRDATHLHSYHRTVLEHPHTFLSECYEPDAKRTLQTPGRQRTARARRYTYIKGLATMTMNGLNGRAGTSRRPIRRSLAGSDIVNVGDTSRPQDAHKSQMNQSEERNDICSAHPDSAAVQQSCNEAGKAPYGVPKSVNEAIIDITKLRTLSS